MRLKGTVEMMDEARKARERDFHDLRFSPRGARGATGKYYSITVESHARYHDLIWDGIAGKRVLEYGCGPGSQTFELARRGAIVCGIDISPVAIDRARERAQEEGLADRIEFSVRDAEATEFPPQSFDLVTCNAILHHLDLRRSYAEIVRLLRPGGRGVFIEPLGENPLINAYRRATPSARTPDEHPLVRADFALARQYFGEVRPSYYHIAAIAAAPLWKTPVFKPFLATLSALDRALLTAIPPLRPYAWLAVIELRASIAARAHASV